MNDLNKDMINADNLTVKTVSYDIVTNRDGAPIMESNPEKGGNVLNLKVKTNDGKSTWVAINKNNAKIRYNVDNSSKVVLKKYHQAKTGTDYYVVSHVDLNSGTNSI